MKNNDQDTAAILKVGKCKICGLTIEEYFIRLNEIFEGTPFVYEAKDEIARECFAIYSLSENEERVLCLDCVQKEELEY